MQCPVLAFLWQARCYLKAKGEHFKTTRRKLTSGLSEKGEMGEEGEAIPWREGLEREGGGGRKINREERQGDGVRER